ncbi:MAG TPA: tetratricopeptide repeat protein, partial [Myxococcaceae bacterium]|nr:tetratricopeptide repeat protein [Myxococcaceae bacterium]
RNWEGLLSVFDLEAEAAQEPRERAARLYKAAELLERQLRREDEAIARYNQCLQLQPGYLPAQQALIRLYQRQGRYGDLIAMYEHDIGLTTERDQIISTLNEMAAIYEEKLSDLDRAIDCMKRILELDPQHVPTTRNLSRMLEYAGQWRELIQVQEREASTCTDTKQILALHHHNAEILEGQLSDKGGAIEAYRRLLSLSPSYLPALKALGRLYSEQGSWQELVEMYRAEADIASSPDHAAFLLFRAGELIERRLVDSEQAIPVYREALQLSPSCLPALRALEQIYRSRKDWEKLLEVLHSEAAHRSDPRERARALFQAAGICEAHLNSPDEAIDTYLEVIRLAPGHAAATAALKRLYTAQGNLQEMVAILDGEAKAAETSQAKITAQLKLADLYLDRLDEPRLAAQACQAILALEPANLQALKMLERASAADRSHSSELKLKLAAAVSDSRLRAALHLAALSNGLADEGTVQKLLEQFAETTPDARPGMLVEAALRRHGKSEELLAHYQRMAQATADPLERLGLLFRLADLAEHRAEQPATALKAYRAALELNPQLVPALQGVARCALKLGDFAAAKEALEAEGNASRDVRSALEAFVAAGRLCAEQLRDSDGAIANFRRALERDPLDPSASAALRDLLSGGKAEDLASFHERSAEAKLAQHELSAAAADFLTAAHTWLEKSSDPARALRAVERSLAAQPGHAGALEMKGQLALDAHQFREAAAAYAARVQLGGDIEKLIPIHLKLGALYQDYLSDATRAAAHLQTVLAAQPSNPAALERLATVHINAKNWSGAAESLKALLELEGEPSARARHSLLLAKVYEEGFSNPALASSLYRRALELAPGDLSIVGRLTELYQRMGNPAELVQVLEQQLQNAGGAQHESALRVKVGNLYAQSLGRPDQAATNYRLALESDPTCLEAGVALAELYMHDAAAAPDAIEAHRRVLRLEPTRAESLHALFRLWHGLKQTDRAFCAAAVLRFLGSANDAELAYHKSGSSRLERAEPRPLSPGQLNGLCHADAKGPILDVLRAIGDQLAKLYPADFNRLGIQWRTHRVKAEHPAFKSVQATMRLFGVSTYEACRMPSGSVTVEIADPFFVCIPDEVLDKPGREQCALLGRAAFSMANKTPIIHKLALSELADLTGAAIRLCVPDFASLGSAREELSRQLLKALSRKARKALESSLQVIGPRAGDLEHWLEAWTLSEDRAALIAAGDPYTALAVTLGKEANAAAERSGAALTAAARRRLEELVGFALSEEHFLLREQIGSAL